MTQTPTASRLCQLLASCFLLGCIALGVLPARADEGADWKAFNLVDNGLNQKAAQPENAVAAWQQFLESKPGAVVGSMALFRIAELQRAQKKFVEAVATSDQAAVLYPGEAATVLVLPGKAATLRESGQPARAFALFEDNWALMTKASRSGNAQVAMHNSLALKEIVKAATEVYGIETSADKKATVLKQRQEMLQRILVEMPLYLDDRKQGASGYFEGWMQAALLDALNSGDAEDRKSMLGWARFYYMTCPFEPKVIERAGAALTKAWIANDDFAAVNAFARAQEEPDAAAIPTATSAQAMTSQAKVKSQDEPKSKETKAKESAVPPAINPLQRITLAPLSASSARFVRERLAALRDRLDFDRDRVREIIDLDLVQAAFAASGAARTAAEKAALRDAMEQAKLLLADKPDDAEGVSQICRVFKAADGSTRRANAFLAYLNGKGRNPIFDFFKEMT